MIHKETPSYGTKPGTGCCLFPVTPEYHKKQHCHKEQYYCNERPGNGQSPVSSQAHYNASVYEKKDRPECCRWREHKADKHRFRHTFPQPHAAGEPDYGNYEI